MSSLIWFWFVLLGGLDCRGHYINPPPPKKKDMGKNLKLKYMEVSTINNVW